MFAHSGICVVALLNVASGFGGHQNQAEWDLGPSGADGGSNDELSASSSCREKYKCCELKIRGVFACVLGEHIMGWDFPHDKPKCQNFQEEGGWRHGYSCDRSTGHYTKYSYSLGVKNQCNLFVLQGPGGTSGFHVDPGSRDRNLVVTETARGHKEAMFTYVTSRILHILSGFKIPQDFTQSQLFLIVGSDSRGERSYVRRFHKQLCEGRLVNIATNPNSQLKNADAVLVFLAGAEAETKEVRENIAKMIKGKPPKAPVAVVNLLPDA